MFGKSKAERKMQKEYNWMIEAQKKEDLRQRIINNENIVALVSHYEEIFNTNSNELKYLRMKGDYVYTIQVECSGVTNELTQWIGTNPKTIMRDGLLFSDVGMNDLPLNGAVTILIDYLAERINAIGTIESYINGHRIVIRANKSAMQNW